MIVKPNPLLRLLTIIVIMSVEQSTTYFENRMSQLGITSEFNQVKLWRTADGGKNELQPLPIFKEHPKGIEIIPYTLDRTTIRIEKEGSRIKKDWSIVRLEKPIVKENGDTIKYLMPKGKGSFPLITPNIVEAFEKKQQLPTLFLTEGYFKAWKGFIHGLPMIGLPSITHMRDKEKGTLHADILKIITHCDVRRAVWLTDGDCLDITGKAITDKKDLYTRPFNFFDSICKFKQYLDDLDHLEKYFFHIDTAGILERANFMKDIDQKLSADKAKGLDDIMITYPDKIPAIVEDLNAVSRPGDWFIRYNVTNGTSKVRDYFRLSDVTRFYEFHCERRPDLKGKEFKFHGTLYKYNEETNTCEIKVPAESQQFFRVGDNYYKHIFIPNKYGQKEKTFRGRRKGTIIDDYGAAFCKHIPKYEEFCNTPNNTNFQPVIDSCFNLYSPMDYQPDEEACGAEECPTIIGFIQHIFGHKTARFKHPKTGEKHEYQMWELGLDYVQLLYQIPAQKLPILCLVSKQQNTGKSTFGFFLKLLFGSNVAIVGNQDLAGDFNAHWATKLVVICDETKIDKQHVVEKVKSLSTANKITMNAKGKDHVEIDCFIKFIFITNNEDTFISMTEEDIRYWVLKVPILKQENTDIQSNFIEEFPAFLSYLNNRKLATENLSRMWFYKDLLRTDALNKVIENSGSSVKKELRFNLRQMFLDFGVKEIRMSLTNLKDRFFKNKEANYVDRVLRDDFNLRTEQWYRYGDMTFDDEATAVEYVKAKEKVDHDLETWRFIKREGKVRRYTYPWWDYKIEMGKAPERVMILCKETGRPFVFKRENFLEENEDAIVSAEIRDALADPDVHPVNGQATQPGLYGPPPTGADREEPIDDLPF